MAKKSERSLLLWCMLFAFSCLLLHGGGRLIAGAEEPMVPARPALVRAVLCEAPLSRPQTGAPAKARAAGVRMHAVPAPDHQNLNQPVLSDANGNVLAARSYMRTVYQAFTLDDGFV